mmetsp:Transcript_18838/g.47862  ORF Transcript_18838/g.47862 Transcript_18838/m.47862 type:complete len:94 (+) Transcript_18838:1803-2084(+)
MPASACLTEVKWSTLALWRRQGIDQRAERREEAKWELLPTKNMRKPTLCSSATADSTDVAPLWWKTAQHEGVSEGEESGGERSACGGSEVWQV